MSNIYLKFTIEKSWRSKNFDFLNLKNSSAGQFLEIPNSRRYHWILKLFVATQKSEYGSKSVCGFSIFLILTGKIKTFTKLKWIENGKYHTTF